MIDEVALNQVLDELTGAAWCTRFCGPCCGQSLPSVEDNPAGRRDADRLVE